MGKVRTFYGHGGPVPPTGTNPRRREVEEEIVEEIDDTELDETELDETELDEGDLDGTELDEGDLEERGDDDESDDDESSDGDEEIADAIVDTIELPDNSWKVPAIDEFIDKHEIDVAADAKKPAKIEAIKAWAAALPEAPTDTIEE